MHAHLRKRNICISCRLPKKLSRAAIIVVSRKERRARDVVRTKGGIFDWFTFRGPAAILLLHSRYIRVDAHSMQPVNYVRTRRASSRPRDNGKMNAKWRTRRHLSIRDLDWRSLFLSDSSFHAIDDHSGLRERSGSSFLLLFFFFFLFSFFPFLSKRLHNNRPWCAAELELLCSEEVFLPSRRLSRESLLQLPITTYDIKRTLFAAETVSLGFPVFPAFIFFLLSCFERQLRNHRNA